MSLISPPVYLSANPHYYDYLHVLELKADGEIEMLDGAGQFINTLIKGRYELDAQSLRLFDLVEYDAYSKEKLLELPAVTHQPKKQAGQFAFQQELPFRIDNPDEQPCLLFHARYIFDFDPISGTDDSTNLYHVMENKDFGDSQKIFYADTDLEKLTLTELKKRGIDPT